MTHLTHTVSADGAVRTITLDSHPGNIIDMAMCAELRPAITDAAADSDAKVLVLRGAGKHFSFGASVTEHLPETAPDMLAAVGGVIRDLIGFPYPTVAGIQGRCLGGGLELALACGILIAEETAVVASPEIRLGVFAPAATALLQGRGAEDVLLSGRDLNATEAHAIGIINLVVPDASLDESIDVYTAEHFAPRSAASLRMATRAVREPRRHGIEQRLETAERLYIDELLLLHDGVEGIQAFIDKRQPHWTNQ